MNKIEEHVCPRCGVPMTMSHAAHCPRGGYLNKPAGLKKAPAPPAPPRRNTGKDADLAINWIGECVDGWMDQSHRNWEDERQVLISSLRVAHAAHCEALNDPHSALAKCNRITEDLAQRRIDDARHRWTVEQELCRQWREECETRRETMAQAAEFLQALKRNIDESGPLPKYDGAAVEAVIHMMDATNPKLKGVSHE